jgi:hypothetical protein
MTNDTTNIDIITGVIAIVRNRCVSTGCRAFLDRQIEVRSERNISEFVDNFVNEWSIFRIDNAISIHDDVRMRALCSFMNQIVA